MGFRQTALRRLLSSCLCLMVIVVRGVSAAPSGAANSSAPPGIGDEAKDFELVNLTGKSIKLSTVAESGPVVLVVLRGFPGYQCPLCTAQVGQLLAYEKEFRGAKATVLLVYPGPAESLKKHAAEFSNDMKLPANFHLLLDPDYELTKAYNLRWNAPRETAYPSTFVIDTERKIRFAKVSKSHGDRVSADQIIKSLQSP